MAEAMCDEVVAESAKPAEDPVQVDSIGANKEDAASGKKTEAASPMGHEQPTATVAEAGEPLAATPRPVPEAKAPKSDEVRRSVDHAAETEGQTANDAKMYRAGKVDLKGGTGAASTRQAEDTEVALEPHKTKASEGAPVKQMVVADGQRLDHTNKTISSTVHANRSGNEGKDEPSSHDQFWKTTDRDAIFSEKVETPVPASHDIPQKPTRSGSSNKKGVQKPVVTYEIGNEPTKVEQSAVDTKAQEVVDGIVAEAQFLKGYPDRTNTETTSPLSTKKHSRAEHTVEEGHIPANVMNEQHSGTRESTTTKVVAVGNTTEDLNRKTPLNLIRHDTTNPEPEPTTYRATRAITASKLALTSAISRSNYEQAEAKGASGSTSGTPPKDSADEKADAEKKMSTSPKEHEGTTKIPDQVVKTDELSSGSLEVKPIPFRFRTKNTDTGSMTRASEATIKIVQLSESLSDKTTIRKMARAKQTSKIKIPQPGGGTEVLLSDSGPEDVRGVPSEGSIVGQPSGGLKMESTIAESESPKFKTCISKKKKGPLTKQKSSIESTNTNSKTQQPTEEAPSSAMVSPSDSCGEQTPGKTPEGTGAEDQITSKQSHRKPAKTAKISSFPKHETVSEAPDGAAADGEAAVTELQVPKTDTETSAVISKGDGSKEKSTLSKTVPSQKSVGKVRKTPPRRKKGATDPADTKKPITPTGESVIEPSTAKTTDRDETSVLTPSETIEVHSKDAFADEINAISQLRKTTGAQKPNNKKTKKTVSKTVNYSTPESAPQGTEATVADVASNSTPTFPTNTESVSSVSTKKSATKNEPDNVKEKHKRNVKETKTQQTKGKTLTATTKTGGQIPQQVERINDQNENIVLREDDLEVQMVFENEHIKINPANAHPGRKLNNKSTKTTAKKSESQPAADSQKDTSSSKIGSLRTVCVPGTAADKNEEHLDQKKSDTKVAKDQMKPAESDNGDEKKTLKDRQPHKNETVSSSGIIKNEDNGIHLADPVTQSSERDPVGTHEELRKIARPTQRNLDRRSAQVKEYKRSTAVKKNEKHLSETARKEKSGDNSEIKSTEMQEPVAKTESANRFTQASDSPHTDRDPSPNMITPPVKTVESQKKNVRLASPIAPSEKSPDSIVNGCSAVQATDNTTKPILTTSVADSIASEASSRKTLSRPKNTRKENTPEKKLEEVYEPVSGHSEMKPQIRNDNETSTTTTTSTAAAAEVVVQFSTDSTQPEGTGVDLGSKVTATKNVSGKARAPNSPSDRKPNSKMETAPTKKSNSMVAIIKSKSRTTVEVEQPKLTFSGDTGPTNSKTASLKKSESFTATSMHNKVKRQSAEDKGAISSSRQQESLPRQQKTRHEQGKLRTSASQDKNTKENDSGQGLQRSSSKPISSSTKEGKTETKIPVVFETSVSELEDKVKLEENNQLTTTNSHKADADGKSPRKGKPNQSLKSEEGVEKTEKGNAGRPAKESNTPQEKSVESAANTGLSPSGTSGSLRSRRRKLAQNNEETKTIVETKEMDSRENTSELVKDISEEKSHKARKKENGPESGLLKHGNLPLKRTDEEVGAEAKEKPAVVKHETKTNDKINNVDSMQKKAGQVKHDKVPNTVTVTLKTVDDKGSSKTFAGDIARTGKIVECVISSSVKPEEEEANRSKEVSRIVSVVKKKEQRSSKPHEYTGQTSTPGEQMAASVTPTTGDAVNLGSPRKQTVDQREAKAKAKSIVGDIFLEQKSKSLGYTEADPQVKQHVGTNHEEITSAKIAGSPHSTPRKSPRTISKTTPASSSKSDAPLITNSFDKVETTESTRIAIVEIEEIKGVPVSIKEKQKSSAHCGEDSTKAVEKASRRYPSASPRSKHAAGKKGVVLTNRVCEHPEENTAAVLAQYATKTEADNLKHSGNDGSESARSTSPQRLISQLRTFMTQASLLNKLDLKSKILECMGINKVQDGYKIPGSHGKMRAPAAKVVTDLKKVAAALKVGRKRLEDQVSSKVLEKDKVEFIPLEESKKQLLDDATIPDVAVKPCFETAVEARNKLFFKAGTLYFGKHGEKKSPTGSSCLSSSSDTLRPILIKDRARRRKGRIERKGVPRVRFSDTTSGFTTPSSRPSHNQGSKRQRRVSTKPESPARVKKVSPLRHGGNTDRKHAIGIVSSTMLALKRMHPSNIEKTCPHSSRSGSKALPSAAAAMVAVAMDAREIAKVSRHGANAPEQRAATERRSRSPRSASEVKRAKAKEADKKRHWKSEQRAGEVVIRGLTAVAANFPAAARMEEGIGEFLPVRHVKKRRERTADDYDRTPVIPQNYSEADKPVSPRRILGRPAEKVVPGWHSGSHTPSPRRKSGGGATSDKSPALRVLHDNKGPIRTNTMVTNLPPKEVPCSVAITKTLSVAGPSKRSQQSSRPSRKGTGAARASIEHVVNIDIRMGSLEKDSTASEVNREQPETSSTKNAILTKDSSVGTEEMQVVDVCIRALPAVEDEGVQDGVPDEASVQTLMRAKGTTQSGGGDVDDAACDSSESLLALTDLQPCGAGDRMAAFGYGAGGEGDDDSGAESDATSKTWPRATLVTPTTKTLAASFPRFSTASVPEEAARATAALERSLRLVGRACEARPLECDLRWSAWLSALHAGDPAAAATPFPASLSRSGRHDVDAALAAAVRVPALWLLAGLRAADLGARTVKLLYWLLVRLPAEGPALRALDPSELKCPCMPSAAFKVRVCAGSSLDARLRWRARGLPAFEAWASPAPCQLHALVCGGATTPVGVLSLTLAGALRRAQPGYGCGASKLGSRLRCVLKCDVAHHPELVERIGSDAVVVRGLDLVRVRQLLVFSEPLPEGALAAWAARALKKRRLVVAVAAILFSYVLVAAITWVADSAITGPGNGPNYGLRNFLPWQDKPEPSIAKPKFSFWA